MVRGARQTGCLIGSGNGKELCLGRSPPGEARKSRGLAPGASWPSAWIRLPGPVCPPLIHAWPLRGGALAGLRYLPRRG